MNNTVHTCITLLIILSLYNYANASDNFIVRKVNWGMTKQQVINSEKPNKIKSTIKNGLIFIDKIFNKNAFIGYIFVDNKLDAVNISFKGKNYTNDELNKIYNDMHKILSDKYELIKDDSWNSAFKSDKSNILLFNISDNGNDAVMIVYINKETADKRKIENEKIFERDSRQF